MMTTSAAVVYNITLSFKTTLQSLQRHATAINGFGVIGLVVVVVVVVVVVLD